MAKDKPLTPIETLEHVVQWLNERCTLLVAAAPSADGRQDGPADQQVLWHPDMDISIEDAIDRYREENPDRFEPASPE